MSEKPKENLFTDFPPVSTSEWESKIQQDLKGADYNKKLIWKTLEDFEVRPYYREENLQDKDYLDSPPGSFPFIRGNKINSNEWLIRQDIKIKSVEQANKKVLDILNKGVNSLCFKNCSKIDDIEKLLNDICCNAVEINFNAGELSLEIAKNYSNYLKNKYSDLTEIKGSIGYSPLESLVLNGEFYFNNEDQSFVKATDLFNLLDEFKNIRLISVKGENYHNAGASIVEELAFSLAEGNEYLSRLTDLDIKIDSAASKIDFTLATGSNYFFEIAKLRAARMLWASIVKAYQPGSEKSCRMFIHCGTSTWNKSVYDPYVNMLRSTTEGMSSVIGGTDSLTIDAFNKSYEEPSDFSERVARNQQIILKEEAYLSKVADPSAGSYYIETLTDNIAREAWQLFQEIEKEGGFIKAFTKGIVQEKIEETTKKRDLAIAIRKEVLLGTNQYPNFTEKKDQVSIQENQSNSSNTSIKLLKLYRGAEAFEKVRMKTDNFSKNNKRPIVFLLTYGNLAMRRARAQFSANFFACAGFEIIDNNGFSTIKEGLNEASKKKADIVVLCSSDDEYEKILIDKVPNNEKILVIAGYPKNIMDDLNSNGFKYFIHIKSNVLESLKEYQKLLGI